MFGSAIDVTNLDRDAVKAARARLRLSQAETARRMYAYVKANGPGHEGSVALSGDGFGWVSESACRRAVSDLENGKRYIKEVQYVDSMLAVLGLTRDEIGLVDAKVY